MNGQIERRFAGHDPAAGYDTGGTPWQGRTLTGTGFDHDTGAADPALTRVLADPSDDGLVVAALAGARLLVPVVAVAGETVRDETTGLVSDAASDMAAVTLTAADGTRALPVFSSTAALTGWNDQARPVPVTAARAAQAAITEECHVLVIDPPAVGQSAADLTHPTYTVRGSMVWALAQEREWTPPDLDPVVGQALTAVVEAEPLLLAADRRAGPGGEVIVRLMVDLGSARDLVPALLQRVAARLADPEVRIRLDGVAIDLTGPS